LPEHRERSIGAGEDYVRTTGGVSVPPWSAAASEKAGTPLPIGISA